MGKPEEIRTAFERGARALTLKPSLGRETSVSRTRLVDGLACEVTEGPWKLAVDMPAALAGGDTAPTPGVLGRAALGSCLAIGYALRAARVGIPIESLEVEVQADYDNGALLGTTDGVPPGYLAVRYIVTIASSAPEAKILELLDEADKHSPYRDTFARAQPLQREVRIVGRER